MRYDRGLIAFPADRQSWTPVEDSFCVRLLLTLLVSALLLPRPAAADEQAEPRAILDKAIKAKVDEAAMGKVVAVHMKFESESYGLDIGLLSDVDVDHQGLDKARVVISSSTANTAIPVEACVSNGKEGWIKRDRMETKTMSEAEKEGWIKRNRTETKAMSGAEAA